MLAWQQPSCGSDAHQKSQLFGSMMSGQTRSVWLRWTTGRALVDEWVREAINQSIKQASNPGCEQKGLTDWKWSTWAKRQCCPKNPQADLDICFHPHHVLQTESSQKLWSDERQRCPGSPGRERREVWGHRCSSPVLYLLNRSLSQHQFDSQTWLGSLETPSLLLVQIITIPVSWNGAPTAKSETF